MGLVKSQLMNEIAGATDELVEKYILDWNTVYDELWDLWSEDDMLCSKEDFVEAYEDVNYPWRKK